jgi:hypothetical protein
MLADPAQTIAQPASIGTLITTALISGAVIGGILGALIKGWFDKHIIRVKDKIAFRSDKEIKAWEALIETSEVLFKCWRRVDKDFLNQAQVREILHTEIPELFEKIEPHFKHMKDPATMREKVVVLKEAIRDDLKQQLANMNLETLAEKLEAVREQVGERKFRRVSIDSAYQTLLEDYDTWYHYD